MLKLKKVVLQLKDSEFELIQESLVKTKADNFLFLFTEYRKGKMGDDEIMGQINVNTNAFYAMKSRLYDRIQNSLLDNKKDLSRETFDLLSNIPKFIYATPRETAEAMLHRLENDLIAQDKPADLVIVYSALKKINIHSQKYYHYSQLYNKHMAYTMAMEKAEDLLGTFNRTLASWYFSRSAQDMEMLLRIRREIKNVLALNDEAYHIEIIYNVAVIQLFVFCDVELGEEEEAISDLVEKTISTIEKFPNDNHYRHFLPVAEYLKFEYLRKTGQSKKAIPYFENLLAGIETWLLNSGNCMAFKLLLTALEFKPEPGKENLTIEPDTQFICDPADFFSGVIVSLYKAVVLLENGKLKESASLLNDALNKGSFKDSQHLEIELKLTLAYVYTKQQDFDLAANLVRSVSRKIKVTEDHPYENALDFCKVLTLLSGETTSGGAAQKISSALKMFSLNNSGEHKILSFLQREINLLKDKFKGKEV
jgi:tetratricopeptide (TPR) repeat protein